MKLLEGNLLIAEFLNWRQNKEIGVDYDEWMDEDGLLILFGRTGGELKFHIDWNWLMLAVEKISKYVYESEVVDGEEYIDYAYPRTFAMPSKEGQFMVRFNRCSVFSSDRLIEATWLSVLDFIQYNFNKEFE